MRLNEGKKFIQIPKKTVGWLVCKRENMNGNLQRRTRRCILMSDYASHTEESSAAVAVYKTTAGRGLSRPAAVRRPRVIFHGPPLKLCYAGSITFRSRVPCLSPIMHVRKARAGRATKAQTRFWVGSPLVFPEMAEEFTETENSHPPACKTNHRSVYWMPLAGELRSSVARLWCRIIESVYESFRLLLLFFDRSSHGDPTFTVNVFT